MDDRRIASANIWQCVRARFLKSRRTASRGQPRAIPRADLRDEERQDQTRQPSDALVFDVIGVIPEKARRGETIANMPGAGRHAHAVRERTRDAEDHIVPAQVELFKRARIQRQ